MKNLNQPLAMLEEHTKKQATELAESLWKVSQTERDIRPFERQSILFALFFYKYLCEHANAATIDNKSSSSRKIYRFSIPSDSHITTIRKGQEGQHLVDKLLTAVYKLERANIEELSGIFPTLLATLNGRTEIISHNERYVCTLLDALNQYSFSEKEIPTVSLSHCFDMLLQRSTDEAGKAGLIVDIPPEISQLITKVLSPKSDETIYDPWCGTGSLLTYIAKMSGFKTCSKNLYGQEANTVNFAISKINKIIHGLQHANITQGNALYNPSFLSNQAPSGLMGFDFIISAPPFGYQVDSRMLSSHVTNNFRWGIPPKNRGDYAVISYALTSAKKYSGKVALVVSSSVLFRQGKEQIIRKNIVEDKLLDAVISLPNNIFPHTSIPTAILIFRKDRPANKKVLFIDISSHFTQERRKNVLRQHSIDLVVNAYRSFNNEDLKSTDIAHSRLSYTATIQEIANNNYNLIPSQYVEKTKASNVIEIPFLNEEIEFIDEAIQHIRNRIQDKLKLLEFNK